MLDSPKSVFSTFVQEKPKTSIDKENPQQAPSNIEKPIDFKETLFKIKRFHPHCKSKSMEKSLFPLIPKNTQTSTFHALKGLDSKIPLPFPNKTNMLFLQNLKTTIYSQLSKKDLSHKIHTLYKFQKERDQIKQKFNKDKEKLGLLLRTEKKRNAIIKEEEKEYFSGLETLHKKFQTLHVNPNSNDASKFVSYMEFQNSVKDKEYLIGKRRKEIEEQVTQTYKEFHEKRGRRVMEWKLA